MCAPACTYVCAPACTCVRTCMHMLCQGKLLLHITLECHTCGGVHTLPSEHGNHSYIHNTSHAPCLSSIYVLAWREAYDTDHTTNIHTLTTTPDSDYIPIPKIVIISHSESVLFNSNQILFTFPRLFKVLVEIRQKTQIISLHKECLLYQMAAAVFTRKIHKPGLCVYSTGRATASINNKHSNSIITSYKACAAFADWNRRMCVVQKKSEKVKRSDSED